MKNSINKLFEVFFQITKKTSLYSSCLLLILMIVFPMQYNWIKITFILLSMLKPIVNIYQGQYILNIESFVWILTYTSFGIVWSFLGYINRQHDSFGFLRVYGVWPLVIYLILQNFNVNIGLRALNNTFTLSIILILILNFNSIFESFGLPYFNILLNLDKSQVVGVHPGYVQLNSNSIGSLFFLVPYAIVFSFRNYLITKKISNFVIYTLLMILVFLSSRRMLILICIVMTILALVFLFKKAKLKLSFFKLSLLIILLFILTILIVLNLNIDFANLYQRLFFKGDYSFGISYRTLKSIYFLNNMTWLSFIFGNGGGMAPFEIVYIKLIYEVGIFGILIYLALLLYPIYLILIRKNDFSFKSTILISVAFGSISLILAMVSNPFESFDYIWILIMPIYILNNRGYGNEI